MHVSPPLPTCLLQDMAIWLLQSTALDLVLRPWDKEDEQQMAEELPEPMYAGARAALWCDMPQRWHACVLAPTRAL